MEPLTHDDLVVERLEKGGEVCHGLGPPRLPFFTKYLDVKIKYIKYSCRDKSDTKEEYYREKRKKATPKLSRSILYNATLGVSLSTIMYDK